MIPRMDANRYRCLAVLTGLIAALTSRGDGQTLETETARLMKRGAVDVAGNFEYQWSVDGAESALPFAIEYGLTDRFELLVEPVALTAIRPKVGPRATGIGDLEVTTTYLAWRESSGFPAVAFAGEVKLPTAANALIGTGKADYAGYLILSRRLGQLDAHANLGYTVVGRPAGAALKNILTVALAGVLPLHAHGKAELYGEVLANTASSSNPEANGTVAGGTAVPEAAGGEIVGTLGAATYVFSTLKVSVGVSVDNNGAVLFRPGFVLRLR